MTRRPLPARAPATLLREAPLLKALFGEAQRLDRLQRLLEAQLQPAAREHCRVASWRDGSLLLIVTDGHWATRLRYQQRRLLRQLQSHEEFGNLTKIVFRVQPPMSPARAAGRIPTHSERAAESLEQTAAGIQDPRLRAALERLARHVRPTE
ncbi:DUF721 domain-containing protein [Stutzerimonas azotifigens]|uniref:DUF721 domain-containing protein n=1 Tax=Stutzerimonas azotifigens TaxID=291995 RepID=UPI000489CECB|nr:DciA family protein [Stutzerimonas azotifigens]